MRSFLLEILTPAKKIFSGDVVSLSAKALDGEIGILADHAPLVTALVEGYIRYRTESGTEEKVQNNKGFLVVCENKATVLFKQLSAEKGEL